MKQTPSNDNVTADYDICIRMIVVLVRHPAVQVRPGTCYGRLEVPLRPDGVARIPRLAAKIFAHGIPRVWTSPASRCRVVAGAVVAMGGAELMVDPRLQEFDFGAWEGLAWDAIPRSELDRWAATPRGFAPPGGESEQAFLERVCRAHQEIRAGGKDCAVISHGGPLKVLSALLRGTSPNLRAPAPAMESITIISC